MSNHCRNERRRRVVCQSWSATDSGRRMRVVEQADATL